MRISLKCDMIFFARMHRFSTRFHRTVIPSWREQETLCHTRHAPTLLNAATESAKFYFGLCGVSKEVIPLSATSDIRNSSKDFFELISQQLTEQRKRKNEETLSLLVMATIAFPSDFEPIMNFFAVVLDSWSKQTSTDVLMPLVCAAHCLSAFRLLTNDVSKIHVINKMVMKYLDHILPHVKKLRFPGGCLLCDVLSRADCPKASYIDFLDRISANWRLIVLPEDVTRVVHFLNIYCISNSPRINSHIDARFSTIYPNLSANDALTYFMFSPLRREFSAKLLPKINISAMAEEDIPPFINMSLTKKCFYKPQKYLIIYERITRTANTRKTLQFVLHLVYSTIAYVPASATLAMKITKKFIQYDCLFAKDSSKESREKLYLPTQISSNAEDERSCALIDRDFLRQLLIVLNSASSELRATRCGSSKVFLVFSALLAPLFQMHHMSDSLKLQLISIHFKLGMKNTSSMRAYLSDVVTRRKDLTCEEVITVVSASFALEEDLKQVAGRVLHCMTPHFDTIDSTQIIELLEIFEAAVTGCQKFYGSIAQRIFHLRNTFSTPQSCKILRILARAGFFDHAAFKGIKNTIESKVSELNFFDLANLLQAFALAPISLARDPLEESIIERACSMAGKADPQNACRILAILARRPLQYKILIGCYSTRVIAILEELDGKKLLDVFINFLKLGVREQRVFEKVLERILIKKYELGEGEVGELIFACSKVFKKHPELYRELSLRVIAFAPSMTAATCTKVMVAFAATKSINDELFAVILHRILDLRENLSPSQLQSLFESFSRLSVPAAALCHAVLPSMPEHLSILTLQETLEVLHLFTLSKVFNHRFIKSISGRLNYYSKGITVNISITIIECFSKIKADPSDLFSTLLTILSTDILKLTSPQLCRILTAFLPFAHYKEDATLRKIVLRFDKWFTEELDTSAKEEFTNCHNQVVAKLLT